ncbi:MAG: peptidoglycan-binding domain-containing protein [Chloroflexota bacterium]
MTARPSAALPVTVVMGVGVVAFWLGASVGPRRAAVETQTPVETIEVRSGSVGRALRIPVAAAWQRSTTVPARREGTLTSVDVEPDAAVTPGTTVATIDLEPVVVAQGSVPMFRTLADGIEGEDVRQLQDLLVAHGDLVGPASGVFDATTTEAVRSWQARIGATPDGEVRPGALVFLTSFPARLTIVPAVGDPLGPESDLLALLGATPTFEASVGSGQRPDLATGRAISIEGLDGEPWLGTLGQARTLDDVTFTVGISDVDCGEGCASIPTTGSTDLTGSVVVVPEVAGPVVPTSVMTRDASGGFALTLADGTTRRVRVLAQADGFAVVDGVEPGTVVQMAAGGA